MLIARHPEHPFQYSLVETPREQDRRSILLLEGDEKMRPPERWTVRRHEARARISTLYEDWAGPRRRRPGGSDLPLSAPDAFACGDDDCDND